MVNIYLVTIDSLRYDRFTSKYFPRTWSRFERDFCVFESAYANGSGTPIAFPSLITRNVIGSDVNLTTDATTIAEAFDGFSWAYTNNPHLNSVRGYSRGFDEFQTRITDDSLIGPKIGALKNFLNQYDIAGTGYHMVKDWIGIGPEGPSPPSDGASKVFDHLLEASDGHTGLFWGHLMEPHYPFTPSKITDRRIDVDATGSKISDLNQEFIDGGPVQDIDVLEELYDESIRFVDRQLEEFFVELESREVYDESLIVFVADHGEGFGEEDVYGHPWDVEPIDALVRIPVAVKFPESRHAGNYDHVVQQTDIARTIFEAAGAEPEGPTLLSTDDRTVICKSGVAVRVIDPSGEGTKRESKTRVDDGLSSSARGTLNAESIPEVTTLSGEVVGGSSGETDNVKQRLAALGCRR